MSIHQIKNTVFRGQPLGTASKVMIMVHGRGASADSGLKLPPWEEYRRDKIEAHLQPISLDAALAKYPVG